MTSGQDFHIKALRQGSFLGQIIALSLELLFQILSGTGYIIALPVLNQL